MSSSGRRDLIAAPLRGNVGTRINKVSRGDYTSSALAGAGFVRTGLHEHMAE